MKIDGRITMLVGTEGTRIELYDSDSSLTFAQIDLTPSQLSSALSRLAHTKCEITLRGLDKVGKKMEMREFVFDAPREYMGSKDSEELREIAQRLLDEEGKDWINDGYFGSQNTFFRSPDGVNKVRTTARRWVLNPAQ